MSQEFPAIRFRAAKPSGDDPVLEARALVAQRVAIHIHDRLLALQNAGLVPHTGERMLLPSNPAVWLSHAFVECQMPTLQVYVP